MKTSSVLRASGMLVFGFLGLAGPALADAVTHWNNIAVTAVVAGRPGPVGGLDLALVQAAVNDAVQSIEGEFESYRVTIEGASGSSSAAAAAAAHGVLRGLYPSQASTLDTALTDYLTANGLLGNPGIAVGQQVAAAMLPLYRAAPSPQPTFAGGTAPGEWRPTPNYIGTPPPPTATTMTTPWLGSVVPFTLSSSTQFRAAPPPPLWSRHYARDYDEVKRMGGFASTALTTLDRTPEQTNLAYFWSENFLAQWNRALRAIAEAHVPALADAARLFALANLANADAAITAWDSKLHYNLWRPLTAIQEGNADSNRRTQGDPDWHPLINNPPYPDYTSGANNLTGAFTRTLKLFFGTDDFDFTVTSNSPALTDPATRTRTYHRFSEAAQEVVDARVLLGIHFRFADEAARQQGRRVARWAFRHYLRPVRCPHR